MPLDHLLWRVCRWACKHPRPTATPSSLTLSPLLSRYFLRNLFVTTLPEAPAQMGYSIQSNRLLRCDAHMP